MPDFDFFGKVEVLNYHFSVPTPVLSPQYKADSKGKDKTIKGNFLEDNMIIHGDNLLALKALLPTHRGKVKCIYIDPPYNTGEQGWVYNDNVNSKMMKQWLGKVVKQDDLDRHDKWLCMMYPRLQLLRELLTDDGVIFISIDDNEQHSLRMIMNEIFNEDNFVANIIWRKKAGGGEDSKHFSREHEYILCYRKTEDFKMNFRLNVVEESSFKKLKNNRKARFIKLEKWGSNSYKTDRPTMFYPIKDPDGNDFYPKAPSGKDGNWRTRPLCLDDDHIHWEKNKKEEWVPYEVKYFDEAPKEKIVKDRTIFYDLATTTDAAYEQKIIFGEKKLDNSKPSLLLYRLIQLGSDENSIILDSFAGSGTTAHATLALNKVDGGNRKFILIECEDYADDITAERVHRVIRGVSAAKEENLKEGLGSAFTYCEFGESVDYKEIIQGKNLPDYDALSRLLFLQATNTPLLKPPSENKNWFVGETDDYQIYVIYKPDTDFLLSHDAMLTLDFLNKVKKGLKDGQQAIIFASGRYVEYEDLRDKKALFCYIPHEIHKQ